MRKRIASQLLFMVCIVVSSFAADLKTKADISNVTVYLQGATIYSNASVQIPAGVSQINIEKLSQYVDANSVQVAGKGNFTILGVVSQLNYLEKQEQSKKITELQLKRKLLVNDQKSINNENEVYMAEEKLLEKNMDLKGVNTGLQVVELEKAANFYRTRLMEIKKRKLDNTNKSQLLAEQISALDNELNQLQSTVNEPTAEVLVTVSSKIAQTIELHLSYYVAQAGWTPFYDVRVKDVASPIAITYKAKINQYTGVSWNNVKVTLSTGNPSLGGTVPQLYKWILRNQVERAVKVGYGSMKKEAATSYDAEMSAPAELAIVAESAPDAKASYNYAQVSQKTTTTEFEIEEPISIGTDGKEAQVTIKDYSIASEYTYVCVPKLDTDAFLVASVTGYESYNFISGTANLYFEGAYVGESYLNLEQALDTLKLSLGRDKGIVVERKRVDDYTAKKVLGQKRKEQQSWEISVKNNKQVPIAIEIQDHIPVSGQSEIEVTDVTHPEGVVDAKTSIVTWRLKIEKGASKKVQIAYQILYPKDWIVNTK